MDTTNLDSPAKTHEERIALLVIAQQFRSLSGFVERLANSTNRNIGVYRSVTDRSMGESYSALAALETHVGDVNGGTHPRFDNGQMAETAKAAGGVLVVKGGSNE